MLNCILSLLATEKKYSYDCMPSYYSDTIIIVENRLFSTYAFSAFQRLFSCVFRKSQLDFKISSWYLVKKSSTWLQDAPSNEMILYTKDAGIKKKLDLSLTFTWKSFEF